MPINLSALNMFRSATNWDNKGVANLDHKYAVLNDHVYGGWLSSIGRDDDEKEANNKVRAELLRSLGLAFKLKGMSEDGDGRLRFSTGFMDRLGQLLGKSLKRGDFGIDNDGYVASGKSHSIEPLKRYIVNNARFFVTKAIDNYFAAKEAGKLDVYFNFLWNPGACLEDQCVELTEFEANNLVQGGDDLSEKEKTDLRLIAEGRPLDLPPNAVDLFTSDVFIEIEGEEWFDSAKGWTKEVSDAAKAALRGKKCIMQDFSAEHELGQKVPEFKDADHLPIVNELTDELIDEIGPKAFREYFRVDPRGAKA